MPTFVYFLVVKEEIRKSHKVNSSEALIKGVAQNPTSGYFEDRFMCFTKLIQKVPTVVTSLRMGGW